MHITFSEVSGETGIKNKMWHKFLFIKKKKDFFISSFTSDYFLHQLLKNSIGFSMSVAKREPLFMVFFLFFFIEWDHRRIQCIWNRFSLYFLKQVEIRFWFSVMLLLYIPNFLKTLQASDTFIFCTHNEIVDRSCQQSP